MNKQIGIHFGALSDSIEEQLKNQEFSFNKKEIDLLQEDLDAIIRLHIRGYIVDSAIDKIHKKLFTCRAKESLMSSALG